MKILNHFIVTEVAGHLTLNRPVCSSSYDSGVSAIVSDRVGGPKRTELNERASVE